MERNNFKVSRVLNEKLHIKWQIRLKMVSLRQSGCATNRGSPLKFPNSRNAFEIKSEALSSRRLNAF